MMVMLDDDQELRTGSDFIGALRQRENWFTRFVSSGEGAFVTLQTQWFCCGRTQPVFFAQRFLLIRTQRFQSNVGRRAGYKFMYGDATSDFSFYFCCARWKPSLNSPVTTSSAKEDPCTTAHADSMDNIMPRSWKPNWPW